MKDRVVYFLGAGFSASFGLPTIGNFLSTARVQEFQGDRGGEHYRQVLDEIRRIAVIMTVYKANMDNVEEVLSILQMNFPSERRDYQTIKQFVVDVIKNATPGHEPLNRPWESDWRKFIFGQNRRMAPLPLFVSAIHNLTFTMNAGAISWEKRDTASVDYDIITTNYDMLLENAAEHLTHVSPQSPPIHFRRSAADPETWPLLAKLHGSVHDNSVVPPTQAKDLSDDLREQWVLAREALARAQHIRFIGYSLPPADAYVRYLLMSAAVDTNNLKSISLCCWEPDGKHDVLDRYRALFAKDFEFAGRKFDDILIQMLNVWDMNQDDRQSHAAQIMEYQHRELVR